MLLRTVTMKNFRQYHGQVRLAFAVSQEKNVTIIHGENGVGKTSLLNAIKWAFFGKLTNNFRNPANLVNETAKKTGKKNCSVEIEFEEDGREYLIIRSYTQDNKRSIFKLYQQDGDVWGAELDEPDLIINGMLPSEMAEYFFFQGEGSNAVDAGNNEGNLAQSIRDILGFKVAEALLSDLLKLSNEARRNIAAQDTSGEAEKLDQTIKRDEGYLIGYQKSNRNAEELLPGLNTKLEEVENELALIENQDLQLLRTEEQGLSSKLKKCQESKKQFEKRKYSNISKYGWAIFGHEFANSSLDFIDESQLKGRLPEPYNKTFIEDILSEAKCICGNDLMHGSEGYKKITEMLAKAANPALLQRLSGIRAQIQDINTLYSVCKDTINNDLKGFDDIDERIQKLIIKLKAISERINLIPEVKINSLRRKRANIKKDIDEQNQLLGKSSVKVEDLLASIEKNTKKLKTISPNTEIIEAFQDKKDFIDTLKNYLQEYLNRTEKNIRLHVLKEVNSTLEKFSRHDFHIKVNESDFSFRLLDKDNNNVGQGDGLNLLLNLTITAALINFAAERRNVKDSILASATIAPLIIDAPFGVLDKKYRNVVVKQLPLHAGQVVFLVSSSQWSTEMDNEVRERIGAEYCLIMEETSPQKNKELDVTNIQGRDFVLSRYNCDIDRTIVEEIK
jgi:DNA sulfur modification protein DndD